MTVATKLELRSFTRDWLRKGVIPTLAADLRRRWAEMYPEAAEYHLSVAAEWDRIAAKFPDKLRQSYLMRLDYAIGCLANQTPGSELARYWQDEAAKWDRMISALEDTE